MFKLSCFHPKKAKLKIAVSDAPDKENPRGNCLEQQNMVSNWVSAFSSFVERGKQPVTRKPYMYSLGMGHLPLSTKTG